MLKPSWYGMQSMVGYGGRGWQSPTRLRSTHGTPDWSPQILSYYPNMNEKWGNQVGVIPPEEIYRFFQDYHRHLRLQGVERS